VLHIADQVSIPLEEIELQAVRAPGPGGQNVNKVASAIHLRFAIAPSSLPQHYKERLRQLRDSRITADGVIIIKAQRFRSQERNRQDALDRLAGLLRSAGITPKQRRPTRPSRASRRRRVDEKTRRGQVKSLRGKVDT